jgi:hypothetical protein
MSMGTRVTIRADAEVVTAAESATLTALELLVTPSLVDLVGARQFLENLRELGFCVVRTK